METSYTTDTNSMSNSEDQQRHVNVLGDSTNRVHGETVINVNSKENGGHVTFADTKGSSAMKQKKKKQPRRSNVTKSTSRVSPARNSRKPSVLVRKRKYGSSPKQNVSPTQVKASVTKRAKSSPPKRSFSKQSRGTSYKNDVASKQTAASKAKARAKLAPQKQPGSETVRAEKANSNAKESEERQAQPQSLHNSGAKAHVNLPTLSDTSNHAKEKQLLMLLSSCVKEAQLQCQLERYEDAMRLYDDLAEKYPFVKTRALFWIGKSKIEELRQEPAKAFDIITSGLSACREEEREHDSLTQAMFQLNRSMRRMPAVLSSVKKRQTASKIDQSVITEKSEETEEQTQINVSATTEQEVDTTSQSMSYQPHHDDTIASVARKLDMDYSNISDIGHKFAPTSSERVVSTDSTSGAQCFQETQCAATFETSQTCNVSFPDTASLGSVSDEDEDKSEQGWVAVSNVSMDDSTVLTTSILSNSANEDSVNKDQICSVAWLGNNSTTVAASTTSVPHVTSVQAETETNIQPTTKTPVKRTPTKSLSKSQPTHKSGNDEQGGTSELMGSVVIFDEVPARKKTAAEFGSEAFVSPVRRSVRVNKYSEKASDKKSKSASKQMIPNSRQLLQKTGYAFSPNPSVKCRGAPLNASGICHPRSPQWVKSSNTPSKCWSADNAKRRQAARPPVSPDQASYIKAVEKAFSAKKPSKNIADSSALNESFEERDSISNKRAIEYVRGSVASAVSSAAFTTAPYQAPSRNGATAAAVSPRKLNETAANTFNFNVTAQTHGKCSPTPSGREMQEIHSPVVQDRQPINRSTERLSEDEDQDESDAHNGKRRRSSIVRSLHCAATLAEEAQNQREKDHEGAAAQLGDNAAEIETINVSTTPQQQSTSRKRTAANRSTPRRSDRIREKKRAVTDDGEARRPK
eukprot:gb/GECG01015697.1/.p1 GENE.gb/GECG01015697.1/~~gb/GECG01015697.1/.p1  ORF type:complete len:919 (+),score=154.70 gb/GECG01015697.1/:1-2757(+)